MAGSVPSIDISERERVLESLAICFEAGLTEAVVAVRSRGIAVESQALQKLSLGAVLDELGEGTLGFEVHYFSGIIGTVVSLASRSTTTHLGEFLSGIEDKSDGTISAEVKELYSEFLGKVVQGANREFARRFEKKIDSAPPELVGSDDPAKAMDALRESYESGYRMTFRVVAESTFDVSLHFLVHEELLASLRELLPGYVSTSTVEDVASSSDAGDARGKEDSPSTPETLEFAEASGPVRDSSSWNIDLILDVELPISVSFGEAEMPLRDILKLGVGSVIELNKSVNDPVTIIVNQKTVARGEVVMVDGNYGVRIREVESTADRIRSLAQ